MDIDLEKRLGSDDVPEIVSRLLDAKTKSKMLGRLLKLEPHVVSGIHSQYGDPEECLVQVIDEFVKQVDPIPTWRVILAALKHRTIRLKRLADQIEGKIDVDFERNIPVSSTSVLQYGVCTFLVLLFLGLIIGHFVLSDCHQMGLCYSKSLPSVDHFVGREEDIHNITGYLDFTTSDVQVVHIVGPPGFGKSTLAMKIGDILVRKWISVHYVDLRMVKDRDTMAEKVMLSMVVEVKRKVTFDRLESWIRDQYSKNVIILDNCDEFIEHAKDEFLSAVDSITRVSSRRNVRYIITSQKWVANIGNFRLHAIYNLSSEAAIKLLNRVAASLTDDQKKEIAELTGNVPLALEIVGAIFKFPDAPSVEEVIGKLRENLIETLSPDAIHSKVSVSIGLAYHYLSPELQQLCVNLSHFPGSFDSKSASFIYTFKLDMLKILVHRSLLQYNTAKRRYFFHQLLQEYFLHANNKEMDKQLKHSFNNKFLLYFTDFLCEIADACDHGDDLDIVSLQEEEINIRHILFLLNDSNTDINATFYVIKMFGNDLRMAVLTGMISPEVPLILYGFLESFEPEVRKMVDSFFEVYVEVVLLAVKSREKPDIAAKFLSSKRHVIENAYKEGNISANTYTKYFHKLAYYFEKNGDEKNSKWCHIRVLRYAKSQLEHCYPCCDYYSISVAYHKIGEREKAFEFRKLAYLKQDNIDPMNKYHLILELYNDYLSQDNRDDAEKLRIIILEETYPYLMNAGAYLYFEDTYLAAIKHFQKLNMEDHAIRLQEKVYEIINIKDKNEKHIMQCTQNFQAQGVYNAVKFNCIHLAVLLGKHSLQSEHMTIHLSFTVGHGLYSKGNYSESQIWLQRSLGLVREALLEDYSMVLRNSRGTICLYLILSGDYTEPLCFAYLVKDTMTVLGEIIMDEIYQKYIVGGETIQQQQQHQIKPPITKALTVEKCTYIWQYYVKSLEHIFEQKIDFLEKKLIPVMLSHPLIYLGTHIFRSIFTVYVISIFMIARIACFMHTYFSEKQTAFCMSCFSFCIFSSSFLTVLVCLFLLFLDQLY